MKFTRIRVNLKSSKDKSFLQKQSSKKLGFRSVAKQIPETLNHNRNDNEYYDDTGFGDLSFKDLFPEFDIGDVDGDENEDELEIEKKEESDKRIRTKEEIIRDWFENTVGLSQYYLLFLDEGLDDFTIIRELNMSQLEKIGIKKLGHRIKIMQEIDKLACSECGRHLRRIW